MWNRLQNLNFEGQLAKSELSLSDALRLIDYGVYFDLLNISAPTSVEGIVHGLLKVAIENEDSPFIIASNLMECDKPKDLPAFMIEYITALYEAEIADGNHHAI